MNIADKKFLFVGNSLLTMLNFRGHVIKDFSSLGFEVFVLAPFDTDLVKIKNVHFINLDSMRNSFSPTNFISNVIKLRGFIKKLNKSNLFIFSYSPFVILISLLAIFRIRCSFYPFFIGLGELFLYKRYKFIRQFLGYIIDFSPSLKKVICLNAADKIVLSKYIKSKSIIILDGEGLSPESYKFIKHTNFSRLRFVLISRPRIEKGVLIFLNAVKILREQIPDLNADFIIYGFDVSATNSNLPKNFFLDCNSLNIRIGGYFKKLSDQIQCRDVLVLPSFREGMSRVCMEMREYGVPVIGSNVPGINDIIIVGYSGLLVEDITPISFAKAMKNFYLMSFYDFAQIRKKTFFSERKYKTDKQVFLFYRELTGI